MSEKKLKNSIHNERKHFRENAILQDQQFWKLSNEMEMLLKQKAYLQHQCRKAGALIKSLQENVQELQQTIDKISKGPKDYEDRPVKDFVEMSEELKKIEDRNGF
jgi:chromosome segregation ATPase